MTSFLGKPRGGRVFKVGAILITIVIFLTAILWLTRPSDRPSPTVVDQPTRPEAPPPTDTEPSAVAQPVTTPDVPSSTTVALTAAQNLREARAASTDGNPKVSNLLESMVEAVRLRVKDIDDQMKLLTVRSGKGNKDRFTTFPATLTPVLQNHLAGVKTLHQQDLVLGHGAVYLPYALARKHPNAAKEWGWQYVFPARNLSVDPRAGMTRRHHVDPSVMNKAIKVAVRRADLTKHISAHSFLSA